MIVYLHGFNSSPQSHKANVMREYMARRGKGERYACPRLPVAADEAIASVEALLREHGDRPVCFIGSSLTVEPWYRWTVNGERIGW